MVAPTFVTGATGFVGSAVARNLIAHGHQLKLLVRSSSNRQNIDGLKAELVEGDLAKPESLVNLLKGCRYLFHVAADYRLWVPDPQKMMHINVDGTRELMLAAMKAGVEKIVYCSSVAALGLVGDGSIADETTPVHHIIGDYKQSKYKAEQVVLDLVKIRKLPAVIVNPSTPIGPGDIKPTPTGKMILDCASGKMPAYVDTGLNIVHVEDVANGHRLALEKGRIGEKYILGGENMLLRDVFSIVAEIAGIRPPLIRVNQKILWPIAIFSEWLARTFNIEPRVTREMLQMSYKKMFFSPVKAERELGYTYRPAKEALKDSLLWFWQQGYLK